MINLSILFVLLVEYFVHRVPGLSTLDLHSQVVVTMLNLLARIDIRCSQHVLPESLLCMPYYLILGLFYPF